MNAIDIAHDRAVCERRNFVLTFAAPNRIRAGAAGDQCRWRRDRHDHRSNSSFSRAVRQFLKFAGIPDTPDVFGATSATTFSGTAPVMFTSDGSLVDSNGDVVNGTIFFGIPGQPLTPRAVTIFGVTGLTRSWKWRGAHGME